MNTDIDNQTGNTYTCCTTISPITQPIKQPKSDPDLIGRISNSIKTETGLTINEFQTGQTCTYKITIDPTPQRVKPPKTDKTIGKISNSIRTVTGLTINEFSSSLGQYPSYTWIGGTMNGNLCNENWKSQSVFALDFDKGKITVEDALKKLQDLEIFPQLWYTTLGSSEELHKFRIVLFVDKPVEIIEQRNAIVQGLLELFPEADQKCKNAGRFFFGGKESHVLNYNPIPTQKLLDILCIQLITEDSGHTRKIPANLLGPNKEFVENCTSLYNNNRSAQFPTDFSKKTTYLRGGEVINWDIARTRVKLLDEFLKGEWLHHDQLLGLATNLIWVRGGMKLMKKTMEKYNKMNKTHYTQNNFNITTYLNKVSYPPQPIYTFSKYPEDNETHDLISATKDQYGFIEQIEPIVKILLDEAEKRFKSKFEEVMMDTTPGKIHLFILATAIGKTERILSTNATIACPTNKLKEEIGKRMKVEYVTTPDAVKFENEKINSKIQTYYNIGLPTKATAVLYEIINEKNRSKYSPEDIQRARDYLTQLKESYDSKNTVLTTHARAIHSEFSHDTIIFDEDPLKSLIDVKELKITDLDKLNYQPNLLSKDLENLINHLKSSKEWEIKTTPKFPLEIDDLIEKANLANIDTNLFDFFASSFFIRNSKDLDIIHYVVKRPLPMNKKIIILSATLPIFIYQELFGDKLNIIDIRDVDQVGRVKQYTKKSCSRNSLDRYWHEITKLVGVKPVITFKSYANKFQNPVDNMHFGNCSGYDTMSGKDLAVVGTPHRNNIEYFLIAKVLGIDFKTTDTTMSYQKIEYNGFRFKFNSFDNEELRSIQLALIESDLIQAVGRARTLRTNATVEVYSNFPLKMSDEFIY